MEYEILNNYNFPGDLKKLDEKQISVLIKELRSFITEKTLIHGGHLASNLGVVELTVALHKCFDFSCDRLIFDVGHQCYAHKILSGRISGFDTLRTPGGMSGFTKSSESVYDAFGAGHSSTSLSAALGFVQADKLDGNGKYTVVVVGDGAFTGGMIHEAINNCPKDAKLIIILNENEMSISKNIGRFAENLAKLRSSAKYFKVKRKTKSILKSIPVIGTFLFNTAVRHKKRLKNQLYGSNYFEDMGLYYLGPADGNDYPTLISLIDEAKSYGKSTLIHIKTKKGKGYAPAEDAPSAYHCIKPEGKLTPKTTFSGAFCEYITELSDKNNDICAVTASMANGTGLNAFEKKHPERFFDVGIAEEHALTFCAGLSAAGKLPVFCVYSSFLQRGYDNLIHDIALQRRSVILGIDRCGINSSDGATHNGIFDVSFMSSVPGTRIYSPISYNSLKNALDECIKSKTLCAVRYDNSEQTEFGECPEKFGYKRNGFILSNIIDDSYDVLLITYGKISKEALRAEAILKEKGIKLGVIITEKLSPYCECADNILNILCKTKVPCVFLEEGIRYGGAGEILLDILTNKNVGFTSFDILAIDNSFAELKTTAPAYSQCGISAEDVVKAAENRLSALI